MSGRKSIFLVGPMGAGKTTVGRRLAESLAMEFHDSDREIEERTGASIPLIFDIEGEEGFRRREAAVIDELTQQAGLVLSTGGGAVVTAANRTHLHSRGVVVYLKTSVERQLERTRHDRNRPLLQTADPRARLEELMAVREPLYREIAHLVVDTDAGATQVVREIIDRLDEAHASGDNGAFPEVR